MEFKLLLILMVIGIAHGAPALDDDKVNATSQIVQPAGPTEANPQFSIFQKIRDLKSIYENARYEKYVSMQSEGSKEEEELSSNSSIDLNSPVAIELEELEQNNKTNPSDLPLKMKVEKMVSEQLARGFIKDKMGNKFQMSSLLNILPNLQNSFSGIQKGQGDKRKPATTNANLTVTNNEEDSQTGEFLISADNPNIHTHALMPIKPHSNNNKVIPDGLTLVFNLMSMFLECLCNAMLSIITG